MTTMPKPAGPRSDAPDAFYAACLQVLAASGIPFLLAGTHAINAHTGLARPAGDLDVFCKPADRERILERFRAQGYQTEVTDDRWLAKIKQGPHFADVIFNSSGGVAPVTDAWFAEAHTTRLYGVEVRLLPPTELVWSKLFVQDRYRFDGADVAHVILRRSDRIDWQRLIAYAERYWEVLLAHLLNFRFIYPSERERVPRWVLEELVSRLRQELANPDAAGPRVCRGRILSPNDYLIDVTQWGFADGREEVEGA
jgi:hypothetical protein